MGVYWDYGVCRGVGSQRDQLLLVFLPFLPLECCGWVKKLVEIRSYRDEELELIERIDHIS